MGKTLNIESVQTAMREHGLNQARIAKEIGVSRAAVTKWLTLEGFPRPDKLLKLGMLLKLSFKQLVEESGDPMEPVVAFRRKGGRKTTQDHLERAKHMGLLLRQLATSLPFDQLASPATLRNPVCEYRYLQQVAQKIRKEINVPDTKPVDCVPPLLSDTVSVYLAFFVRSLTDESLQALSCAPFVPSTTGASLRTLAKQLLSIE